MTIPMPGLRTIVEYDLKMYSPWKSMDRPIRLLSMIHRVMPPPSRIAAPPLSLSWATGTHTPIIKDGINATFLSFDATTTAWNIELTKIVNHSICL